MDENVQKLIEEAKKQQRLEYENQKIAKLTSLGIISDKFSKYEADGVTYITTFDKYHFPEDLRDKSHYDCRIGKFALDIRACSAVIKNVKTSAEEISDEDYEELCKYYPEATAEDVHRGAMEARVAKISQSLSHIKGWVIFWSIITILGIIILSVQDCSDRAAVKKAVSTYRYY